MKMGCGCGKKAEEKKFTRNAEYQYRGSDVCLNGREPYLKSEVTKVSALVGGVAALIVGGWAYTKLGKDGYSTVGYGATAGIVSYMAGTGFAFGAKAASQRFDDLCSSDEETTDEPAEESYNDDESAYVSRS
jgi:hypothetical protein